MDRGIPLLDAIIPNKDGEGYRTDAEGRRVSIERALAPDLTYERAGRVLRAAYDPPFFAASYLGLDPVGHTFLRYAQPDRFGDVGATEVRRYGKVLDRYLAYLSASVGETAQGLRPGEVLLVVSAYGLRPASPWRRLASALLREDAPSGVHDDAPDGFILAVGDGIRAGARFESASVLDVMPTILYLMGLPVGRDMEGRVTAEVIDDAFARAHPLTFIPSYESLAVRAPTGSPEAARRLFAMGQPIRGTLLASKRLDAYLSVLKWTIEASVTIQAASVEARPTATVPGWAVAASGMMSRPKSRCDCGSAA